MFNKSIIIVLFAFFFILFDSSFTLLFLLHQFFASPNCQSNGCIVSAGKHEPMKKVVYCVYFSWLNACTGTIYVGLIISYFILLFHRRESFLVANLNSHNARHYFGERSNLNSHFAVVSSVDNHLLFFSTPAFI